MSEFVGWIAAGVLLSVIMFLAGFFLGCGIGGAHEEKQWRIGRRDYKPEGTRL